MRVFLSRLLVACCFVTHIAEGWSPSADPKAASGNVSPSISLSRRGFVATSIVGTVMAGKSLESLAAPPTPTPTTSGLALVAPNSLNDKIVVITGGTTGIGLESGKALAKGGATVILTARTQKKGSTAVATVRKFLKEEGIENDKVYSVQLDLDDLENVKNFPTRFQEKMGGDAKISVLMNNAGVMAIPDLQLTKDGYERTFQSNHLGHFALTAKLVPYLKDDARVINVSSSAYQFAGKGLELDNLNGEKNYSPWGSYSQSKLENILFTQELQRRADAEGIPITVTALHPGVINTDLGRNMMGGEAAWEEKKAKGPTSFFEKVMEATVNKALLTPAEGAATQVYLATTDSEEKGRFYSDLKPQKLAAFATDKKMAKALWERSEQLADLKFSLLR